MSGTTEESENAEGSAVAAWHGWVYRGVVAGWAVAAAGALAAPFGGFFTSGIGPAGGPKRPDLVFDGWGNIGGRFGDNTDVRYIVFGIALYVWAAVLLLAISLALRAELDGEGSSAGPPPAVLAAGLVGSVGLATNASMLWLEGDAWTSNRAPGSEFGLGPAFDFAIVVGVIALLTALATGCLCLAAHGSPMPNRGRTWIRPLLVGASVVVAAVLVVTPFADYLVQSLAETNDTFGALTIDGWGRVDSRSITDDGHGTRYGIVQAVAAAALLVGAACSLVGRHRLLQRAGDALQTAGHACTVGAGVYLATVAQWWLSFDVGASPGMTLRLGRGLWLVLAVAVGSAAWIFAAYWPLLRPVATRLVHGRRQAGPIDEDPPAPSPLSRPGAADHQQAAQPVARPNPADDDIVTF